MSDRDAFRANRDAGLRARQAKRLEQATYTAAEVKVLTEAALRLGRKEAGEEIAVRLDQLAENYQATAVAHRDLSDRTTAKGQTHRRTASAFRNKADGAWAAAHLAREMASQPLGAASDAISGVPRHSEVSEAPKAPQEPYECSCYKLAPGILEFGQHHPDCPNAPRGDA